MFIQNYVNLLNVEAFFVRELPPIVFKRFSATLYYSVMIQMILALINTLQILNINLLMNLNSKLEVISYFEKIKNLKCNYDIIEDLMDINETDQTYSIISRTNSDNLMRSSLFSFLQQRTFIFVTKNYLYI